MQKRIAKGRLIFFSWMSCDFMMQKCTNGFNYNTWLGVAATTGAGWKLLEKKCAKNLKEKKVFDIRVSRNYDAVSADRPKGGGRHRSAAEFALFWHESC